MGKAVEKSFQPLPTKDILLYNGRMKTKLTLQEKLRDLRDQRGLKLAEVAEATGIPTSTLQRFESDENARVGYQDIETLTKFYDVSADYLFGLTDNRQRRNTEINKLHLSDEAVAELTSGKLNNRLLSEVIAHPDFAELLAGLEVFIDRSVFDNIEIINKVYKASLDTITVKKIPEEQRDEYISQLKEASIDPDGYLRYRLSQRFDKIAQALYEKHEKETLSGEGQGFIKNLMAQVQKYKDVKEATGSAEQAKLAILADQMRVNLKKTTTEERHSMLSFLSKSKIARLFKRRK